MRVGPNPAGLLSFYEEGETPEMPMFRGQVRTQGEDIHL